MWCEEVKNKNGKVKYRFYEKYKDPYTNKWKRVSVVMNRNTKQTQKEALIELTKKIENKKSIKLVENGKITFGTLVYEWFEFYKSTSGTKRSWHIKLGHFINKLFKEIDPDTLALSVDRKLIQDLLIKIVVEQGLTETYARKVKFVIKSSLEYGTNVYNLSTPIFINDVVVPKKVLTRADIQKKKNNYLESHEMNKVLNVFDELIKYEKRPLVKNNIQLIKDISEIQALTGMRIGEVLALTNDDVDYTNRTIEINGSIEWFKTEGGYGNKESTKTENSLRTISINPKVIKIIKRVQLRNKKMLLWEKNYNDRGFIFTNSVGNPLHIGVIAFHLSKVKKVVFGNQNRQLTTHTFRHTHISILTELDLPLKAIMERVGHKDVKTTLKIYTHVTNNMQQKVDRALDNFYF
ncbi:MAG: site-specific integrase [Staphylococcus rostri]|uniref:tyrosine-type recombinase/integrase n=1 Tax=Staphylococcus rostri TaxID=522262 RepID=UPI0026E0CE28|nr:site-specific integrase [Staphylococcus rostri]MDO5375735.1 site-specific integrase [Staphylococcus rostri]